MISIIIPAHNERDRLTTLVPYLQQLGKKCPIEIIVALSPESQNGPYDFVDSPNVQFLKCPEKGRALQMNAGAKKATGEVLAFLHADVMPPRSFFQDIRLACDEGYEAGFFSYKFDSDSFLLKINARFTAKDGVFTGGGDQCLFIKRPVFFELGGFDGKQVLMEDFEFFERMKKNRVKYTIIRKDLIVSARKYRDNSYVRVNLTNLLLLLLFKFGYSPKTLKSIHNRLLNTSYKIDT